MLARGEIEKIICDKCGYANEAQRIFCHECGARLDRSEYLKEVQKRREKEAGETPRRLKEMARVPLGRRLRPWLIIIFGSMLAALLIQFFSAPYIPPAEYTEEVEMAAMDVKIGFEEAAFTQGESQLTLRQDVLNSYLDRRIKPDDEKGDSFWSKSLADAHLDLQKDKLVLVTRRDFFGIPLYFTGGFRFEQEGRRLHAKLVQAKLGRQGLPAFVFGSPSLLFGDVLEAANVRESEVEKITNVELQNNAMRLTVDGTR